MTEDHQKKSIIHIVAGPTASGKSARALELSHEKNGVVINCDSMQIYNGLPLLTAQPSQEDLQKAPHEFYGILDPNDMCSAGNWREMVEPLIQNILDDHKTPIICGGSGLYIKALMEGLSPMPDTPQDVREAAVAKHDELGTAAFYETLKERDPVMAGRLDPANKARLIRAWEVLEATGKSLAEWQEIDKLAPPESWKFEVEIVMPERAELYDRCNKRFVQMIDQGVLNEVADFAAQIERGEVKENAPLANALGFDFLRDHLKGDMSLDEAINLSQGETRRYAKRQSTWFRNQI